MSSALAFELPSELEAREPPEARGVARDGVKLLVAERAAGHIAHRTFRDLPQLLNPGDILVINVSKTLPAAIPARREDGSQTRVHFATRAPGLDPSWRVVELRSADGSRSARGRTGEKLRLRGGATLELVAPYASGHRPARHSASPYQARTESSGGQRLMLGRVDVPIEEYLLSQGDPIRYGYVEHEWPLDAYQNVYSTKPGSAEMPSAGRPFTAELITRLVAGGIVIAPITLHCGVSSPERHEPPFPEYFEVPTSTAKLLELRTGRVIAVGTTVVRALETTAGKPGEGWTHLVVTPDRPLTAVDGLITGWHEPEASHLQLLEAVAGPELLRRSYEQALEHDYLWHEFGDSHLILR
jgi:S-adenosylmethionine:tRNA ribosyltransferase-isomerase